MKQPRCVMRWSLILALLVAGAAQAQQLYRWTDEKGRVHVTDTPPPASARNVQKKNPGATAAESADAPATATPAGQQPYELAQAMKEFPVTLYTSPICKEGCAAARAALNRRGVPFKEVQVWDEKTNAELKERSGDSSVPTLLVGQSVHKGFQQDAYDALLDAARYPRAGLLPPRAQATPKDPEGYVPLDERDAAKPVTAKPAAVEEEAPKGPYSPGSRPPPRPTPKKQ
jgi:glutaredoxin